MNPKLTLLTLGALSVSALNLFADTLVVDGTAHPAESGQTYESVSGTAGLYVFNPGASYSGTNITVSSTFSTGNGSNAVWVNNGGTLALHGATITHADTDTGGNGIRISGTSIGILENINFSGGGRYGGIYVATSSTLTLTGGTISPVGYHNSGIAVNGAGSAADVRNVTIRTTDTGEAYAAMAQNGGHLTIRNSSLATSGGNVPALYAAYNGAFILAEDLTIETTGFQSFGMYAIFSSTILGTRLDITTSGEASPGVESNTALVELTDSAIRTTGANSNGAQIVNSNSRLALRNTTITTTGSGAAGLHFRSSSSDAIQTVTISGGSITSAQGAGVRITTTNTNAQHNLTITDGARITGATGLLMDNNPGVSGTANVILDASTLTGGIHVTNAATLTLDATNHATLTGDLTGIEDANFTLNGSDGVTISGNVTGNDNATIDVTVSGPGSSFTGDITQNDEAAVTVTLDDHATGTGAFNDGDLNTNTGGEWTFTDDSHVNNSDNQGTINIGDHEVTFDNLNNDGTININLNNDTGEGGSITVTGTADGDGKVHIDTTGNGKADPNQVLPGKVTGDGTEHWQWDPIDWGIDTIIKDGDHFIKQGTSPAGAVLNSSVAIQQAMWFAQQNSLLKRMGELRYGARASRPLAGGTPAFHNLIENIWIRSYGQQLNVGSQVAGKAYEQLIYGVDLGTDHKFTLSADSDLYLGVYAGYGRSDLDYRSPGTDGEINSYYGGLYATWLHSSGFYIDATFKAASVNNDLKAPYGSTQLKASYSDVNLGGSIEIGKKFTFADAWFIEPQFQVNYLHILAENYTAGPMTISAQDLDALQLRIGSLFGRTINLTNSGALQPYVKVSGVETISSGGAIKNGYQHTRANTDGARAELGAGLIWQLDANNQLHLDYEASFGDKYDKPWGLTAGYRHQF